VTTARKTPALNRNRLHDLRPWVLLCSGLLIVALWSYLAIDRDASRNRAIDSAIAQNSALALGYEENIRRSLRSLDGILLLVRQEQERLGARMSIDAYVQSGIIDRNLFSLLCVISASGRIVLCNRPSLSVENYTGHEYFEAHRGPAPADQLHIGKPVLRDKTGVWYVPLSRPVLERDGSFGGIILMLVNPDYFTRFHQKAGVSKLGLVSLVGTDGIVRSRRVGGEVSFGGDMSNRNLIVQQADTAIGSFYSTRGVDGVRRYVSYRRVPDYPLVVAVGEAESEVLEDVEQRGRRDILLAAVFTLVVILLTVTLLRMTTRQLRNAAAVAASEAKFRATFEQSTIGIALLSPEGRYLEGNKKLSDMLGFTTDELVGLDAGALLSTESPDARDRSHASVGELLGSPRELQCRRKDGSAIWVNCILSKVEGLDDQPSCYLQVLEDVTKRRQLEQELESLASTDTLTGIPNRRTFSARLEEAHALLQRVPEQPWTVLMLDIDFFKKVNDTWGHAGGDQVLKRLGKLIRSEIRKTDTCGRVGGEEFAVILSGASEVAAVRFAENLRRRVEAEVIRYDGHDIRITVSIGVSGMAPDNGEAGAAMVRADSALYAAKHNGRNRVEVERA
jgi:diguanylate cyclase (GGDEF)-like protein/PAS domain S-box-containing protein